jgi:hypothetical protein
LLGVEEIDILAARVKLVLDEKVGGRKNFGMKKRKLQEV